MISSVVRMENCTHDTFLTVAAIERSDGPKGVNEARGERTTEGSERAKARWNDLKQDRTS